MKDISRRSFLKTMGLFTVSAVGTVLAGCGGDSDNSNQTEMDQSKGTWQFPDGIASGDPRPDSVVLWTHISSKTFNHQGKNIEVIVQLADLAFDDPQFSAANLLIAHPIVAQQKFDYTIHHRVEGLAPSKHYWYRFIVSKDQSIQGRTKTAPALDSDPALKFAYLSCQDYSANHWGAYALLAQDQYDDLDFIVHLGDYIYETADAMFQSSTAEPLHRNNPIDSSKLSGETASGTRYAKSVEDYRYLYHCYRADPRIQAIQAKFPIIVIWDDHEFTDDAWQASETYTIKNENQVDRRRAANQAWFEAMPVTLEDVNFEPSNSTNYDNIRIYREFAFGKTMQLIMTDERLYREDHMVPEQEGLNSMVAYLTRICAELGDTEDPNGVYQFIHGSRVVIYGPPIPGVPSITMSFEKILNDIINEASLPFGIDAGTDLTVVKPMMIDIMELMTGEEIDPDAYLSVKDFFEAFGEIDVPLLLSRFHDDKDDFSGLGARYAVLQEVLLAFEKERSTAAVAMLGEAQTGWWKERISAAHSKGTVWKVWGNEVSLLNMHLQINRIRTQNLKLEGEMGMMTNILIGFVIAIKYLLTNEEARANLKYPKDYSSDGSAKTPDGQDIIMFADCWDGYSSARENLCNHLVENKISNVISITGDLHTFLAGAVNDERSGQTALLDFAGAGISSNSFGGLVAGSLDPAELESGSYSGIAPWLTGRGNPSGQLNDLMEQMTTRPDKENNSRDLFSRLIVHFSDEVEWAEGICNGFVTVEADTQKMQFSFHNLRADRDAEGNTIAPDLYMNTDVYAAYERLSQFTVYATGTDPSKVEAAASVWPKFPQRVEKYENPAVRPEIANPESLSSKRHVQSAAMDQQSAALILGIENFIKEQPNNPYAQLFLDAFKSAATK